MECSDKLSDDKKKIFAKISFEKRRSPYVKLLLKILAEGYTVNDIINAKTKDIKTYEWFEPLNPYVSAYFNSSAARIGATWFFSSLKEEDKQLTADHVLHNLYNLIHEDVSKDEVRLIMGYDKPERPKPDENLADKIEKYRLGLLAKNNDHEN